MEQNSEYIVQWTSWWKWKMCLLFSLKKKKVEFLAKPINYSYKDDLYKKNIGSLTIHVIYVYII